MAGIKGMKPYSMEVKLEAVRLFIEEGWPKRRIMELLRIQNDTQIENWVSTYLKYGREGLEQKHKGRPKKQQGVETLEEKLHRLEMENELLRSFLSEVERRRRSKSIIE